MVKVIDTVTITLTGSEGGRDVVYNIVESSTAYHNQTPNEVIEVLERLRKEGKRIRVFYGNTEEGIDWLEEHDTMGTIERSTGKAKVPLMMHSKRSQGGTAILDHCIVKIQVGHLIVYKHPKYIMPKLVVRDMREFPQHYANELKDGFLYQVCRVYSTDGGVLANFTSQAKANNYVMYLRGERNSK